MSENELKIPGSPRQSHVAKTLLEFHSSTYAGALHENTGLNSVPNTLKTSESGSDQARLSERRFLRRDSKAVEFCASFCATPARSCATWEAV